MNVLLVVNDAKTRSQLKTALEIRGHLVTDHIDTKSGWAAYQVRNYAMVIVDCSLPGGDGLEMCQRVRGIPTGHKSLIMVIADSTRFRNLGLISASLADEHLEKPFDLQHLNIRLEIAEHRVNMLQQQAANLESLHKSNELLDSAQQITQVGSWKHDIQTDQIVWSDGIFQILEIDKPATFNNYKFLLNMIHPEDRNKVLHAFNKAVSNYLPWEIVHRLLMPDGRVKWVNERCKTFFDEFGKPISTVGSIQDISKHKYNEDELQFSSSVFQAIGDAIIITDSNNYIVSVNKAFTQLSGYSAKELIGKFQSFMHSPRQDEAFNQAIVNKLTATGIWEGEIWNLRKNGEEYAIWQLIHTIFDSNGNVLKRVTLYSSVTEQKRTEEMIRRQAYYDLLTGLPNRRLFQDRLGLEIKKANRINLPIALLFIDLDHFKEVNDTLGHDAGDTLLQEAANRISSCVRESDTVARLGGDEFTVILSEIPDTRHTDNVAQKIVSRLAEPYLINRQIVNVSASIGITIYPEDANNIGSLMKNADRAMYISKSLGRNQFSHFTSSKMQSEQLYANLTYDLRSAMAHGQLKVFYQPIIDLSNGRIHKAEALLRWLHPTLGTISPMQFIPLAEDTGLINQIGDWVFKESAFCAKLWSKQFSAEFQVSINISPVQLQSNQSNLVANWLSHLQELDICNHNVSIEINDRQLSNNDSGIMNKLFSLHDEGIQVSIDNFGEGTSSLTQYKKLDIDYLKIDQSFILNFASVTDNVALSDIIVMAHKLGFKVIAKGVETEGQHDLLTAAKCDYAQGNLYSKPVLPEEFEGLIKHTFITQAPRLSTITSTTSDQTLLSEQNAIDILQPHMPGKSMKVWLAHDRENESVIPFFLEQGLPYYRVADLKYFLANKLNAAPRFDGFRKRLIQDRRDASDRRKNVDPILIKSAAVHETRQRRRIDLGPNLHAPFDRRTTASHDRRDRSRQSVH